VTSAKQGRLQQQCHHLLTKATIETLHGKRWNAREKATATAMSPLPAMPQAKAGRYQEKGKPATVGTPTTFGNHQQHMSLPTVGGQVTAGTPLSAGTPAAADLSALIVKQETGCVSNGKYGLATAEASVSEQHNWFSSCLHNMVKLNSVAKKSYCAGVGVHYSSN